MGSNRASLALCSWMLLEDSKPGLTLCIQAVVMAHNDFDFLVQIAAWVNHWLIIG